MKKRFRVVGNSFNCGKINRVYWEDELFFYEDEKMQELNGYVQCVANRYRTNPRFHKNDVTITEM